MLTFGQIKTSRVPKLLGLCSTSPDLAARVNQIQERLLQAGDWWGTFQRFQICVSDGCVTWPREVEAVRSVSTCCNAYIPFHNTWYSSLGPVSDCGQCRSYLLDLGNFPTINPILNLTSQIKVYTDLTEDAGLKITVMGYNGNKQWIQTPVGGVYIEGEQIPLTNLTLSSSIYSSVVQIVKPITKGPVRLYAYDTATGTETPLGYYEPDETNPDFRRTRLNGFQPTCGSSGDYRIEAIVKLKHVPVVNDTDPLIISSIPAFEDAAQSQTFREAGDLAQGDNYEASAIRQLNRQLRNNSPDEQITVRCRPFGRAGQIRNAF